MSLNLAPTGKTFNKLEITSTTDSDTFPIVLLPESRKTLNNMLRRKREDVDIATQEEQTIGLPPYTPHRRIGMEDIATQEEQIIGILRAIHLDDDWLEITANNGSSIRIYQTGDIIDDVVGSMVNHRVIVKVTVSQRDGRYLYRDIQLEE
jgi:hypothetical protein